VDPKWLTATWWFGKDAKIGWIGGASQHLRSLLGATALTVLCALVCIQGYFDAQIRETLLYK
jgi:hypothetical protein